jgi:hypothetical protein
MEACGDLHPIGWLPISKCAGTVQNVGEDRAGGQRQHQCQRPTAGFDHEQISLTRPEKEKAIAFSSPPERQPVKNLLIALPFFRLPPL